MKSLRMFMLVCGLAATLSSFAQGQSHKVIVDKILAVVGNRIVLQSNIKDAISDMQRQGETVPNGAACSILENSIISKVLAIQAEKDSIPLSDEDVDADVEMRMRSWVMQFGSEQAVEEVAGKSIYQFKEELKPQIREQMLSQRMQRKIVENVRVTPTEVKAFFDEVPTDSLPILESELEVGQINIFPKAAPEVEQYIYSEMMNYRRQIEAGASFADLAKRVSEDPGSRERGGAYEISRNDKENFDPVFISTIFRLKSGEISLPVKSDKFGFFLIKVEERRGDVAKVRMILRIPPVTESELNAAKAKLDSVRQEILDKKINFKDAAYKYSEDEMVKNYGPYVLNGDGSTYITLDRLDREMVNTVGKLKVGEISEPTVFTNEQGKKGVRLVYLRSKTEPHRLNLADDYSKIAEQALTRKKNEELQKWLAERIPSYYILVDQSAVSECTQLSKYHVVSTENGF
ncbi:MAG: peptidylprolyl isomerase [Niabella sp.]